MFDRGHGFALGVGLLDAVCGSGASGSVASGACPVTVAICPHHARVPLAASTITAKKRQAPRVLRSWPSGLNSMLPVLRMNTSGLEKPCHISSDEASPLISWRARPLYPRLRSRFPIVIALDPATCPEDACFTTEGQLPLNDGGTPRLRCVDALTYAPHTGLESPVF